MRHMLRAIGVLALSTAACAQAPYGYVVVAETALSERHNGLLFIDPDTGVFTRTRFREGQDWIGTHQLVALDTTDPKQIFVYGGIGIAGPPLHQMRMEGNRIASFGPATKPVFVGDPAALHVSPAWPGAVLYTTHRVASGLHSRSMADGTEQLIVSIQDAWEVATAAGQVYVSTYRQGTSSKLFKVDLNQKTATEVMLSAGQNAVPAFRAMALAANKANLLVGDDNGVVWSLDPVTGVMASMALGQDRRGAIIAIAAHPTRFAYVATSQGVWDWVGFYTKKPALYVPTNQDQIMDLDVSFHDQGAVIYYGRQCPGAKGMEPYVAFGGYPTQGNNSFAIGIANAAPNAPSLGFVGFSRTHYGNVPLPLDLTAIGMPKCALQTDIAVVLNLATDAQGKATLIGGVPTDPALVGIHVTAQFAIQDSAANPAGISTTEGVELVVR